MARSCDAIDTLNFSDLWDLFGRIAQSIKSFKLIDNFTISVSYVSSLCGRGDPERNVLSNGILNISNNDNLYLARAL